MHMRPRFHREMQVYTYSGINRPVFRTNINDMSLAQIKSRRSNSGSHMVMHYKV